MRRLLWALVALIALAFVLRLYELDRVPLRGDEAYAVRYWADAPETVLRTIADEEPHPVGTFFAFHAWKRAAGDSEFAMRYLPLLGSLIGTAAAAGLARHIFRDDRVALVAAGLWAIHPFIIWHAQDVRNYALWAGLSPLALLLFLRATQTNRARDWSFYLLAQTAAFYSFFFELFLFPAQALYLLLFRRRWPVLERAIFTWGVLAILLLPWLAQAYFLSQSGYEGTTEDADPLRLITWVLPTLLTGDTFGAPWDALLALGWAALVALALFNARVSVRRTLWFAAWIALPALLLLAAATRMSVFHPRYLVALVPLPVILTARALIPPQRPALNAHGLRYAAPLLLVAVPLVGLVTLRDYYTTDNPKAPDWPALAAYLHARTQPGDLIVQNLPDPAFDYYYQGPADSTTLAPQADPAAQLRPETNLYGTIWFLGRQPEAEAFLDANMQRVSFHMVAGNSAMQFRARDPAPGEPQTAADITFGDIAVLRGYTVQGPDSGSRAITVLLYWEPLRQTDADYKVFVHLTGPPKPDGSPLWSQDDHRPQYGTASTRAWPPGSLLRDPYNLLAESPALPPGNYTLRAGFYDPETNERLPVYDSDGNATGDSYPLATLHFPVQ